MSAFKSIVLTLFSYLILIPGLSKAQGNTSPNLLPVCGVVASVQDWFALNPQAIFTDGEIPYFSDSVGRGLYFDCVSQLRLFVRSENVPGGTITVADHLAPLSESTAYQNIINPSAGNKQIITLSSGAGVLTHWSGCYPASSNCPPATYLTDGFSAGVVFFRRRSSDGTFKGGWTVAFGSVTPGFTLRRLPSCSSPASSTCNYEIVFPTDFSGNPVFGADTQVILKVGYVIKEGEQFVYNDTMGIPLYISASSSSVRPTATPTSPPSPTNTPIFQATVAQVLPTATPSPTPTVIVPPNKCLVPNVLSLKLNSAKKAILAAKCRVGEITRIYSSKVADGLVTSTSPKALKVVKKNTEVAIKLSRGKPKKK